VRFGATAAAVVCALASDEGETAGASAKRAASVAFAVTVGAGDGVVPPDAGGKAGEEGAGGVLTAGGVLEPGGTTGGVVVPVLPPPVVPPVVPPVEPPVVPPVVSRESSPPSVEPEDPDVVPPPGVPPVDVPVRPESSTSEESSLPADPVVVPGLVTTPLVVCRSAESSDGVVPAPVWGVVVTVPVRVARSSAESVSGDRNGVRGVAVTLGRLRSSRAST
jgi:hypothetical protein